MLPGVTKDSTSALAGTPDYAIGHECAPNADQPAAASEAKRRDRTSQELSATRFALAALCGVFVIAGAVAAWTLFLRDHFVAKQFGVVVPGRIYRSGQISRYLIRDVIDRYQIGTIVDLNGIDRDDVNQAEEIAVVRAKGLSHYRFPLSGDGTGDVNRYADALEVLVNCERRRIPVLVHCSAGAQRTGACVSFYRLLVRRDPPHDVYAELLRYGWEPRKDRVLLEYVNANMTELAERLVERHVLDRKPDPLPVLGP
jgi:protein tyrosine/serine phosphatase